MTFCGKTYEYIFFPDAKYFWNISDAWLRKLKLTKSRNFNNSTWKAFKNLIQKAYEIPSFAFKNETKTNIFHA